MSFPRVLSRTCFHLSTRSARTCASRLGPLQSLSQMSTNRYELTPEQLALAEERQRKRLEREKERAKAAKQQDPRAQILSRGWMKLKEPMDDSRTVKVVSWNVCLFLCCNTAFVLNSSKCPVRCLLSASFVSMLSRISWAAQLLGYLGRELFPTSDCLKASQREHMLYNEVLSHRADICCLQVNYSLPLSQIATRSEGPYRRSTVRRSSFLC